MKFPNSVVVSVSFRFGQFIGFHDFEESNFAISQMRYINRLAAAYYQIFYSQVPQQKRLVRILDKTVWDIWDYHQQTLK